MTVKRDVFDICILSYLYSTISSCTCCSRTTWSV